ncbi:MAG: cysteine desulfurase family protein, partial [Candidatus Peregrinibacteria bacterium]
ARETISKILNCRSSEIIFTSGGTESNNLAIFGTAKTAGTKNRHLITSKIEHSSVLEPFQKLEKEGFESTYLKTDREGFVNLEDLKGSLRPDTTLVSIMYANNEIGTIEPIPEIGQICHEANVTFHTDACQAGGSLLLDTQELNVDMMTLNAGKIYGPKGVGLLFIRRGTKIEQIIFGGGQEQNLRSGTHNVPGIIGFAKALQLAHSEQKEENARLVLLRDRLIEGILKIEKTHLNGPRTQRLPNNVNVTIEDIEAPHLVLVLDEAGIYTSTGSACRIGEISHSPVLLAIGLTDTQTQSTLRLTLGKKTTEQDIDFTIRTLTEIVQKLRNH